MHATRGAWTCKWMICQEETLERLDAHDSDILETIVCGQRGAKSYTLPGENHQPMGRWAIPLHMRLLPAVIARVH